MNRRKFPITEESGSALTGVLSLLIVVILALGTLAFVFGTLVPPGVIGVRQINFGPGQGVSKVGLEPGLHWRVPFYTDVHFVPQTVQILDFYREKIGESTAPSFPPLEIQTADRATVDVDATVLYSFYSRPGTDETGLVHGGPDTLMTTVGVSPDLWVNKVRRTTDDALKQSLGEVETGQFYDPSLREKQVKVAVDYMNKGSKENGIRGLAEIGIKVEAILLRRYTYREERIENAIFQKNLQDQEEALNLSESKLAQAKARSGEEEARGDQRNQTLKTEGEEDARVVKSEADLYEAQKKAEGDLLVAKAHAEVGRLKATALTKSFGSQLYVAREIGPLLGSLKGGVVTDMDPYDLEAWMKKLGISQSRGDYGRAQ